MTKKKKKDSGSELIAVQGEANQLQEQYMTELETNPKYSLRVNPEGKYKMSDKQIKFVEIYVQYKDITKTAWDMDIDMEEARAYYYSYDSQQEIRRINMAMYQRQFANKLLSLDQIGGYLSSLITDDNVAIGDRLKTREKLQVVNMLIELNKMKVMAFSNPEVVMSKDITADLKNLSVTSIVQLIQQNNNIRDKTKAIEDSDTGLSFEEQAYLKTLPANELFTILNKTNKEVENVGYIEQGNKENT